MRLYSGPLSMFGMKAEIALREKGLPFALEFVPYDKASGYTPKHPDVARINPKGQVPVLIDGAVEVFDSTQIFEYLEDIAPTPALWPGDAANRALARQLEHMADEVYFPQVIRLMGLYGTPDDPAAVAARTAAADYYAAMDARLADGDHLAGAFSYADIALYMAQLFGERMGAVLDTAATPRLADWRARMGKRAAVRRVITPLADYLRQTGRDVPAFVIAAAAG